MNRFTTILFVFFFLVLATSCMAQEVTMFRWGTPTTKMDASPLLPSEIEGYKLHCGTAIDTLASPVDVGNVNEASIDTPLGPHQDGAYLCATTVHLTNGLASAYSGFVSVVKRDGRYFNGDSPSAPSWLRVE